MFRREAKKKQKNKRKTSHKFIIRIQAVVHTTLIQYIHSLLQITHNTYYTSLPPTNVIIMYENEGVQYTQIHISFLFLFALHRKKRIQCATTNQLD